MIAAPYLKRGLGEQIVKWIEAAIKKDGQVTTIFSAVQIKNQGALRFWQKNGYQIISDPEGQTDTTVIYRLPKDIRVFVDSAGRGDSNE
ncbi:MAG: GNAT family N-acetyltransferase [Chloroflexi bacterium]|nr:GNAT family N-acetyltransferase [Chloroflexota bacterium]